MDIATCQQRLEEAQDAYHALLTGGQARQIIDSNGDQVQFTSANQASLVTYIQQLQALCGDCTPVTRAHTRPFGFIF